MIEAIGRDTGIIGGGILGGLINAADLAEELVDPLFIGIPGPFLISGIVDAISLLSNLFVPSYLIRLGLNLITPDVGIF